MLSIVFFAFLGLCDGYKILLFYPIPGKSHSILGEGYVRYLVEAGHEVTYVTPIPIQKPPAGLRQVDVSENTELLSAEVFNVKKLMYREIDLQEMNVIRDVIRVCINGTLLTSSVQQLIHDPKETFDAVVVEWLYAEVGAGLAAVFNCPLIWSTSTELHPVILSLVGASLNPSYSIYIWHRRYSDTLLYRIQYIWSLFLEHYDIWIHESVDAEIYNNAFKTAVELRGRQLPPYNFMKYNASLMLGNSHVAVGDAYETPQAYKAIGGYHLKDEVQPLPKDLQKIMDESKYGVIYFSLGTMLKSSALPEEKKEELLAGFSKLKQTVIWKYEKPMKNLPKNVHVVQWAPQQSILAHPNTVLFITHGGLLSMYELIKYGVPIVGVPMYGDQFTNVNRAVDKGFGRRFDMGDQPIQQLFEQIQEVLENPKYAKRAKDLSVIFNSRLVPPGQELVFWIEHVIKTHGAPHLRSPSLFVSFYQKYFLDLITLVLIINITLIYVIRKLFRNNTKANKKKND